MVRSNSLDSKDPKYDEEFIINTKQLDKPIYGFIETKIIDKGCGIDLKSEGKKLFNTFAFSKQGACQLGQSSTKGIGVGLSTAWALTEALGGTITLKSS